MWYRSSDGGYKKHSGLERGWSIVMPSPNQNDDLSSIIKDVHRVYSYQQEKERGDTYKKYTLIMVEN